MAILQYDDSGTSSGSRFLKPKGGAGLVNVVEDFAWTLTPKNGRTEVPTMRLVEYQQNGGQLIASLLYYARLTNRAFSGDANIVGTDSDPSEAYKFKYIADPTGWRYDLPFFSTTHTSRTNSFGYTDGQNPFTSLSKFGSEVLAFGSQNKGGLASLVGRKVAGLSHLGDFSSGLINTIVPGKVSLETPQSWDNTTNESISVQFHLFNTQSVDDIKNNRNLAHILRHNNTPSRRNFALVDPPVIYSLHVPDVLQLPACYVSSLEITNMGNTRLMDIGDGKKRTIPEAYGFNITFTSLLMPTRNILQALDKGETVEAISNVKGMNQFIIDKTKQIADDMTREGPMTPANFREQFRLNQQQNTLINQITG